MTEPDPPKEDDEPIRALSGLHKMSAPQDFAEGVTRTIEERSAGRFFGRRAFGDRIPYELLAVLALALGLGVYLLMRYSDTGSAEVPVDQAGEIQPISPETREAIPKP